MSKRAHRSKQGSDQADAGKPDHATSRLTFACEIMRETLLYLYSVSAKIHFVAIAALPILIYFFTSKRSSKTTGVIGLSLLTSLFGVMCFIPTVIPENHIYFIFPNVLYAGICAVALFFRTGSKCVIATVEATHDPRISIDNGN